MRPSRPKPATDRPSTEPPLNATFSAPDIPSSFALTAVAAFALVAIVMPIQPAAAEKQAPMTKQIAACQPMPSAPFRAGMKPRIASRAPTPNTNGMMSLNSRVRKVIAPLWM